MEICCFLQKCFRSFAAMSNNEKIMVGACKIFGFSDPLHCIWQYKRLIDVYKQYYWICYQTKKQSISAMDEKNFDM